MLVEQTERTLLGLVALAGQVLERLLALHHLLATHNAAVLVLDQVGLGEAAGGMLRGSVIDHGLGANCRNSRHLILWNAILFTTYRDGVQTNTPEKPLFSTRWVDL